MVVSWKHFVELLKYVARHTFFHDVSAMRSKSVEFKVPHRTYAIRNFDSVESLQIVFRIDPGYEKNL